MKPIERQKICTNCDGRIAIEADSCPYCGTHFAASEEVSAPLFDHQSLNDSLSSLYTPPYSNKSSSFMKAEKEIIKAKPSPKESQESQLNASLGKFNYSGAAATMDQEEKVEDKGSFWPLLLLILGGNLLILGLLQFFFSEGGFLRLEWESKYWFIYCLFALPILYVGFKKARQFQDKH